MMNTYTDLIDLICCQIFGITSVGGGLWYYWNLASSARMLL